MFRSPLQRLALKLHLIGSTPDPLPGPSMEIAVYLNLGVSLVAGGVLVVNAAPFVASVGAVAIAFVSLSIALYHPWWRWLSVTLGSALVLSVGAGVGALLGGGARVAIGGAIGFAFAAAGYGPFIADVLRAGRDRP